MYQVQFNGKTFDVRADSKNVDVNGVPLAWDLIALGNGQFHVRYKNKSFPAEVIKIDREARTVELKVRGNLYTMHMRDDVELMMEKMGLHAAASNKVNAIKAPMPGLIIDLRVQTGDKVKAGDPLLILEAMKMENIIKASAEGTVKAVKVKKGASVEKGQVMIEF